MTIVLYIPCALHRTSTDVSEAGTGISFCSLRQRAWVFSARVSLHWQNEWLCFLESLSWASYFISCE